MKNIEILARINELKIEHARALHALEIEHARALWADGCKFFTVKETALLLGLNEKTVRNLLNPKAQALELVKVSGASHVTRASIETYAGKRNIEIESHDYDMGISGNEFAFMVDEYYSDSNEFWLIREDTLLSDDPIEARISGDILPFLIGQYENPAALVGKRYVLRLP